MKYFGKLLSKLAFFFILCLTNVALASQTIIIYRDFGHKGDENQVRGVVHAYSENVKDVNVKEFNIGQEDQLISFVDDVIKRDDKTPIILSVGEKTVSTFANILPVKGGTAIHLCHMVTANHPQLVGKVNYIALPLHSVGNFEATLSNSQTKLIKTVGVSHNRQINDIDRTYAENKDKLPPNESYVGVILGGDAPTPENKIQLFTEENARELARYVSSNLKGRHLLIINGPRTGKYDPKSLVERKEAHRNGELDFITQAFLDELKNSNVTPKQYSLFDFQFGQ